MVIKILSHMISNILNKPIIGISYSRQNAMENWSICSPTAAKLNSSRIIEDFKLGLVANWWHHLIYFLNHETCAIEWLRALCILLLVKHKTLNSEHCPFFTWYEMPGERLLRSETLIPEKSGRRERVCVCGCVGVCRANIKTWTLTTVVGGISAVGFRPSNGHSCFVVFTYCINSASIESPVLAPSSLLLPSSSSSSQPALPPGNRQQRTHSVHRPRGENNSEKLKN
jgi:hypothetical protein